MNSSLSCLTAMGALLLASCSSTPTQVDRGPIKASSFAFVEPGTRPAPAYADNRAAVHAMLQQAITRTLGERGLHRATQPDQSDITVAYMIIVGDNATTTGINQYFGYGRDSDALHKIAHERYTDSPNPNYFQAGTLVVDLIDTKTYELLWRGHRTRPLLRDLPTDARLAQIQKDVDELLQKVRFAER
jgi:hypothetical protein